MKRSGLFVTTALLVVTGFHTRPALASFHAMQIEQVIGGVNGDTTAQAIQLRMRADFQEHVQFGRLVAYDADGNNPIVLATFAGPVPNQGTGVRVLIASANFAQYSSGTFAANQTMSNLIPASYLAAGSLTWEDSGGTTTYWRLSWGGSGYTGPNSGELLNDLDGDFGPPFPGPLPSTGRIALKFQGAAAATSTTNQADYALTAGAAVFTNNAARNFTVITPPCPTCGGDLNGDSTITAADIQKFVACATANTPGVLGCTCSDIDGNSALDSADITAFANLLLGLSAPPPPCL